jgi:ADP-ribose pyrophosphatase YjhB (NUDIX family)
MPPRAAGFLLWAPTGRLLLLLRGADGSAAAVWSLPGGHIEPGETEDAAARRELEEETGYDGPVDVFGRVDRAGYVTLFGTVDEELEVDLNDEHVEAGWFMEDDLPQPIHPGVVGALRDGGRPRRRA